MPILDAQSTFAEPTTKRENLLGLGEFPPDSLVFGVVLLPLRFAFRMIFVFGEFFRRQVLIDSRKFSVGDDLFSLNDRDGCRVVPMFNRDPTGRRCENVVGGIVQYGAHPQFR